MGKITFVLGTKAEFLRLFPLMLCLQRRKEPYDLVHTCQHDLGDYIERFGVKPDFAVKMEKYAGIQVKVSPRNAWKAVGLYRDLKTILVKMDPSIVVYQGDTFTTGFAAFACRRAGIRAAHVEAGFRSGDWREPFPEESIRKMADHRADLLFAPSAGQLRNLFAENIRGDVVISGSTVRDSVAHVVRLPNQRPAGEYAVVTMHRYENLFSKDRLRRIAKILSFSSLPLVWPMHEHTAQKMKADGLMDSLPRMSIVPPMEYGDFMELVASSAYTITDGGSLEEESIVLGRRSLLLRKRTERVEPVDAKLTFLSMLDPVLAAAQLMVIEQKPLCDPRLNPYNVAAGPASELIADRLIRKGENGD